jgi:hypothetical protein
MKEKFCSWYNVVLTTLVLAVSLTACSSSDDDDVKNFGDRFHVFGFVLSLEDAEGHDLADTTYVGNVLSRLSAVYLDKEYQFRADNKYEGGALLADDIVGLTFENHYSLDSNRQALTFGYFDGYKPSERTQIQLLLDGKEVGTLWYTNDYNRDYQSYDYWNYLHFYFKAAGSETEQAVKNGPYRLLITPQGSAELLPY